MSIIELLKTKEGFVALSSATKEQIKEAEETLNVPFSKEYKDYVASFGVASFIGHELTGVCKSPRLNVVAVTERIRQNYIGFDMKTYVIEETAYDGIVIVQSKNGTIYRVSPDEKPVKVADSMVEYLSE